MDKISSLINLDSLNQPEEINLIKSYVMNKYSEDVGVMIREKDYVIIVNSSALANSLRLNLTDLTKSCHLNKKVMFRISG